MNRKKNQPISKRQKTDQSVSIQHHQEFSGPIPPAEQLEKYNAINPNLVDRIVSLAEREAKNRHENERITLEANITLSNKQFTERRIGQICGAMVGVSALICAGFLGFVGSHTAAGIVGGATVVGLVSVFVTGHYLSKKD